MAEINGKKVVFSAHLHVEGTDTSDATAEASDIKRGKTAYAQDEKLTGTFDGVDSSDANASAEDIKRNKTAYVNNQKITGSFDGVDSSDADATAGDIKRGKTAYVNNTKLTGTYDGIIPAGNQDIETLSEYDVSAKATARISAAERAKIIPENIKKDVTILGVIGTHQGGGADTAVYNSLEQYLEMVYTVTKGTIAGIAADGTYNIYIKKNSAPASSSDYDYYVAGDGADEDTIPASFTASKLYIWCDSGTDSGCFINSPVSVTLQENYDDWTNPYVLTLTGNVTLSLTAGDEDY